MVREDRTASSVGSSRHDDAQIRTFLFADIRGYTSFTQERGDEAAGRLAGKFADIVRRCVEARDGSLHELMGDGAMCVFMSARQAIRAAIDLQRAFVDETVADPSLPFPVGIGLDAGEAVAAAGGLRGGALNLGARLCGIAGPAEILASRELVHLARKIDGVAYVDRGTVQLKNIADPVHVIAIRAEAEDPADDLAFRRALGPAAARLTSAAAGTLQNPYKGLRAFDEADATDFFGREQLVDQLVERFSTTRFLAVVGPSGSGKSSVVRAGLIPALRRGAIDGSEGWPIVDMFPGARPLDGLEAALLRATADPPPTLLEQLEHDEYGLHRAVLRVLPSDRTELVLVIDQFEEVFTLVEDEAARSHFLQSLVAAVTDPRSRLRVVATLRADFYDRPLLYRGFAELFKSRVEAVVPLSPDELERAISGPAKRVDVALEPGLVAAMLADVSEEPGALPLLQYALTELFDARDGRLLTLASYQGIGGVSGALGRSAEELYEDLTDESKEAARQLFLRLVSLGEGTEDTRRRATRSEIASLALDEKPMSNAIDVFGAARLLSFDRDPATGQPTIELAHEALLTAWPRLRGWIDMAREDLRTERRLAAAAAEWLNADRDPSFLLGGSRLEQAELWAAESGVAPTPAEREYVAASAADREARRAEDEARRARERSLERRSVRRLRAVVAVLALAAIVAGALTIFATGQQRKAEVQERTAQARELAAASFANLDVDPERSILLALEAIETTRSVDGSVLPEAEEALHRAVTASRIELTSPNVGGSLDWSPAGVFVTEGPEDESLIDIRDARTGETVRSWTGHEIDINDVRFSDDGSMLATAGDDGALKIWAPDVGDEISSFVTRRQQPVVGLSFDRRGSLVAAAYPEEGVARVVDPASGRLVMEVTGIATGPGDTALSPTGDRLVVGMHFSDEAVVYDVATGSEVLVLPEHRYSVNDVSWSPDGRSIATASGDGAVRVWDAQTGALDAELIGHTGVVISVDWAKDSERLVSSGSDGTARVWQIDGAERREILRLSAQQTRSGTFAAFSPNGTHVITGDIGIQGIKIWDVRPLAGAEVVNLETDVLSPVDVEYLSDGRIAAPSDQGSVTVWDRNGDRSIELGPGAGPSDQGVWRIAVTDELIATVRNFGDTVTAWEADTGDEVFEFSDVRRGLGEISWLDWSDNGAHLVVSTFDGYATIVDAAGERVGFLDEGEDTSIESVAFSPDGHSIASAITPFGNPLDSRVTIRNWKSGEVLATLDVLGPTVVAFDPTGATLAVGTFDGTVELWDVSTHARVRRFAAHSGAVADLVYSLDGSRIATGGEDATARLFDAETGREELVLRGHTYLVTGVSFSPDGERLVTAAPDGTVRVWTLVLDDLIAIAEEELTRGFTDDECRQYLHLQGCSA